MTTGNTPTDDPWFRVGIGLLTIVIVTVLLLIKRHWSLIVDVGTLIGKALLAFIGILLGVYLLGMFVIHVVDTIAHRAGQWIGGS